MSKEIHGFFNDDGTPMNPDLVSKPSLCVMCKKNNDPNQEALCMLNRVDQQGEDDFKCDAYQTKG
ncbi:MAG: hypothetical protein KAI72_04925 [Candidatus Pacebacteria bacterium]|nr:hypothetical protein [Candidatus Paceibacterota bacterium]